MQNPVNTNSSIPVSLAANPAMGKAEVDGLPGRSGWRLIRCWIVARNPFYPLSAVLVLFGIFLLSGDQRLFSGELTQLWFNFGAVEGYGLLVVATALLLCRRGIHYDTLMLVVLATLPMLVPFILISQAAFLGAGLMTLFSAAAAILGLMQFFALRRGIPELPWKGGWPGFFSATVALNVLLPVLIKQLHAQADAIRWAMQMEQYGHLAWNGVLPVLTLAGFVVRFAGGRRLGRFDVGWLPTTWLLLLIAGTATHVACLGYVYSFPWQLTYAYPSMWAAAWIVWWRQPEWAVDWSDRHRQLLVVPPAFVALLAWLVPASSTLCVLNLFNVFCFAWLLWRRPLNRPTGGALLASLVGGLKAMPLEAVPFMPTGTTRVELILLVLALGVIVVGSWRRNPAWGLLVAVAVIHPLQFFWLEAGRDWPLIGQLALVTWWFHSFRWDVEAPFALRLRRTGFTLWWLHSVLWYVQAGGEGKVGLTTIALLVAASAACSAWMRAQRVDWVYVVMALIVAGFQRLPDFLEYGRRIPLGLWILLVGVLSFAMGTLVALGRKRAEASFGEPRD